MKIKPNYLYRVLGELEKEGKVRKDGRAYHPVGSGEVLVDAVGRVAGEAITPAGIPSSQIATASPELRKATGIEATNRTTGVSDIGAPQR